MVQGIAGSLVWIVGFATVAETVGDDSVGSVMGIVTSFAHAGIISGPMVSGFLFGLAGYWAAWSVPLAVLTVDIIARLIMVERPYEPQSDQASETSDMERTGLLGSSTDTAVVPTTLDFYGTVLSSGRVVTALLVSLSIVSLNTGFDATLPLHVRHTFGWGTSATGLSFFCLSVPAVVLSPIAGWLRDRIGTRMPATTAFLVQAVILGFHGIAGDDRLSWASAKTGGPTIFMVSVIAIGMVQPFLLGVAPIELTCESFLGHDIKYRKLRTFSVCEREARANSRDIWSQRRAVTNIFNDRSGCYRWDDPGTDSLGDSYGTSRVFLHELDLE
jgi:MFS family permease